jgi:hypothetical protein
VSDRRVAGIDRERTMQHDTGDTTVSAEDAAILGRFAARASKAADVVITTDDGNYFMLFML